MTGEAPRRQLRVALRVALGLLVLVAAAPLWVDLAGPAGPRWAWGMLDGHDPGFDVLRAAQMTRCLEAGHYSARWAPDMAWGYGVPLFSYYAPGVYYLAAGLHLLGPSLVDAVKLAHLAGFALAAWGAFLLGRDLWGPRAGLVLAALYTFAPYHLADVYVRSSLPESFAFVWPPLVLWGAHGYARTGSAARWLAGAGGLAGLALTHNIALLMLAPLLGLLLLALLPAAPTSGRRWMILLMAAAPAGATAFFWLPALAEIRYLPGEFTSNQFHFSRHFAAPWQLLSRGWGFAITEPGAPGGMPLQLGWPQILTGLAAGVGLAAGRLGGSSVARRWAGLSLAAAAGAVLLMLPVSRPVWEALPPLQLVQLPWRWLLPASFALSLAGAGLAGSATSLPGRRLAWALAAAAVAASLPYCQARYRPAPSDADLGRAGFLGLPHPWATTALQMEYLPRWVTRLPEAPAEPRFVPPPGCTLDQVRPGVDLHFFDAVCSAGASIRANVFYFPGWRAEVDKREVEVQVVPGLGTMEIPVPSGAHRVKLWLADTPVRRGSKFLSLLALVGAAAAHYLGRGRP